LTTAAVDGVQESLVRMEGQERRVGDAFNGVAIFPHSGRGVHVIGADARTLAVAIGSRVAADKGVHGPMLLHAGPLPTGHTMDGVFGRALRSFASDKETKGKRETR